MAKKVEGTGLGLALSRKFVELHGGPDLGQEPGGQSFEKNRSLIRTLGLTKK